MSNFSVKNWFEGLPPERRKLIVVGSVGASVLLLLMIFVTSNENSDKPRAAGGSANKVEYSILTGQDPKKIGIEQLQADNKRTQAQMETMRREMSAMQANNQHAGGSPGNGLPFPYQGGGVVPTLGITTDALQPPVAASGPTVAPVYANDAVVAGAIRTDPASKGDPVVRSPGNRPQQFPTPQPQQAAVSSGPTRPAQGTPGPRPGTKVYTGSDNSDVYRSGDDPSAPPQPQEEKAKIRVLGAQNADSKISGGDHSEAGSASPVRPVTFTEPEFILPTGSIISGTLMTGMDAPVGAAAKKEPFPALIRIKHEAILPNAGLMDIRECFLVASGWGDLSSERVYLRAEGISCQRSDGAIIDATLDAFASGQDGRAGLKGRVIERTGQLVARSLIAGTLSGFASAFKPQAVPQVQIATGSTAQSYQYPQAGFVVGNGLMSGASNAGDQIAKMYADMAKETLPVVEIDSAIPVDFILTKSAFLKFKTVGQIKANNTPSLGPAAQRPAVNPQAAFIPSPNAQGPQIPGMTTTPVSQSTSPFSSR